MKVISLLRPRALLRPLARSSRRATPRVSRPAAPLWRPLSSFASPPGSRRPLSSFALLKEESFDEGVSGEDEEHDEDAAEGKAIARMRRGTQWTTTCSYCPPCPPPLE